MVVVCCTFFRNLLHSQLTRHVVDCNKILSRLHSKVVLNGGKKMEVGKSAGVVLGNKTSYNLLCNKSIIAECTMQSVFIRTSAATQGKKGLDFSRVPVLKEEDLEETFVRGSGPGGQAVNKTNNCVVLIHKPTGIVVKCHESRLQNKNRKLAREMLCTKLDNYLNGDLSIEAQKEALQRKKRFERASRRKKLAAMKEKWQQSRVSADENS